MDASDLLDRLEGEYADATGADTQPEWSGDLWGAHDAIETAFVHTRDPVSFSRVELETRNQVNDETGWYRIELAGRQWQHDYDHPPAGMAVAHEWLETNVDAEEFEAW